MCDWSPAPKDSLSLRPPRGLPITAPTCWPRTSGRESANCSGTRAINPLVILLAVLATISFATGDARAGIVMSLMIALGVGLKLIQEARADSAAAKLKAMISVTATVVREGTPLEIAVAQLVPGDVVKLAAGDMIPGDVRIIEAKDLFVTQGSLTGESFPV